MNRKLKQTRAIAVLARVSTATQGKSGHSLDDQVEEGRRYALEIGATDVRIYEGVESGTTIDRQILDRLLRDIDAGLFQVLVVNDILRLARHPRVMSDVLECLRRSHVELHDLHGELPYDTAEGEFNVMLQSIIGRMTARKGVERSLALRLRLLESGVPAAGRPPWGRRWDGKKGKFVLIPKQARLLREACDLILRHRKSMIQTADALDFPRSSLRKAIEQASLVQVRQRLTGRDFYFACDAILTTEDQRRLVARIAANATVRSKTGAEHLLQGLCRCASCGAPMTGNRFQKGGKPYTYYIHARPPQGKKLPPGCVWQVPADLLENDVLWACTHVIRDSNALRNAIQAAIAERDSNMNELDARIEDLEKDIRQTDKRYERTLDRLINFDEGSETRKRIEDRVKREALKLAELKTERDQLSRQRALLVPPDGTVEQIASKLRSLYWHGVGPSVMMSFAQRREFVRIIVGRSSRNDSKGIFISMKRPPGGSKKDVIWKYRIDGELALAESRIARHFVSSPEVTKIRPHSLEQVRSLASLANATVGIYPPRRDYDYMQSRKKWTSNDLRPCA